MMHYSLTRSKRKTLSVTVSERGVSVRAPLTMPLKKIEAFLQEKEAWITLKYNAIRANVQQSATLYQAFCLCGTRITVQRQDGNQSYFKDETLYISRNADARSVIKRFLKTYAATRLEQAVARMQQIAETQIKSLPGASAGDANFLKELKNIKVADSKRCWGLCRKDGGIRLNFRLLLLPEQLMNYVILHELCHLKHFNHARPFWALMCQIAPDSLKHRTQLKQYGHILNFLNESP